MSNKKQGEELLKKIAKEKALRCHYIDEEELGDEFCRRVNCNACFGSDENGESNGYGCHYRDDYIEKNDEKIVDYDEGYFLLAGKIEQLEKENAMMREALEFYADKNSVGYNTKTAKEVLTKIKGEI